MTTAVTTKTRTTDSTDRTAALATAKTVPARSKTLATRFGDNARRLMNALMRSLASSHV